MNNMGVTFHHMRQARPQFHISSTFSHSSLSSCPYLKYFEARSDTISHRQMFTRSTNLCLRQPITASSPMLHLSVLSHMRLIDIVTVPDQGSAVSARPLKLFGNASRNWVYLNYTHRLVLASQVRAARLPIGAHGYVLIGRTSSAADNLDSTIFQYVLPS